MNNRIALHSKLEEILGSSHVYFQPPKNQQMIYPCILYKRIKFNNQFADNRVYYQKDRYEIIVLDKNPESEVTRKLSLFDTIYHDRQYVIDGLYHDVFTLYY